MVPSLLGQGRFSSQMQTPEWGTDLKLQRQSWQYENASLAITLAGEFCFYGQATAPGYYTCRVKLCWPALKAGEDSYSTDRESSFTLV